MPINLKYQHVKRFVHDSIYLLVRNSAKVVQWVNTTLIDCMKWQELEEIKHPQIKLTSEVEVYWPDWSNGVELPNYTNSEEIKILCVDAEKEYKNV